MPEFEVSGDVCLRESGHGAYMRMSAWGDMDSCLYVNLLLSVVVYYSMFFLS